MDTRIEEVSTDPKNLQQLEAMRKEAGRRIDPETAEVTFSYCWTLDPYGDCSDLPEELRQVGREYFARSPGEDTWVWFGDLPETTRDALWKKLTSPSATNGVECLKDLSMIPHKTIQETEQLSGISGTAYAGEPTEDRPDSMERLDRLADESASVIAEMAAEVEAYFHDDARSYVQDGFARMVTARLAAMQKGKLKVHERWPTESEDDYINRVARDEAGGWLKEQRQLIVSALAKPGDLTEEQLKLLSAQALVMMENVQEESNDEERQHGQWTSNRTLDESDDDFVRRVAKDEAGPVLLKKRRVLAAALNGLGNLAQEEVRQTSAETLLSIEKAYDYHEYVANFDQGETMRRWRPLVLYWDFLRRSEPGGTQSGESSDDLPF